MFIMEERSTFWPLFMCPSFPSEEIVMVRPVEPRGMVRAKDVERRARKVVSLYMIAGVEVTRRILIVIKLRY